MALVFIFGSDRVENGISFLNIIPGDLWLKTSPILIMKKINTQGINSIMYRDITNFSV